MSKLQYSLLAGLVLSISALMQCTSSVAGGASDTEVSATLTGTVLDPAGNIIPGALVRLRPKEYLPGTKSEYAFADTVTVFDGTVNEKGIFTVDNVSDGAYVLEIISGDTVGAIIPLHLDSSVSVTAVLQPFGTVTGNIDMYNHPGIYDKATLEFYGTEHKGAPDSLGRFALSLPYGDFRMRLSADTAIFDEAVFQFRMQPAQITAIGTLRMSAPGLPCNSYSCDSLVLRTLLDSAGHRDVPVEQVSSMAFNRIFRLNLRGLPMPVPLAPLAQLNGLTFIDIGNTGSKDSCRFVMTMWGLEELHIDSNNITGLSQAFEYLGGLRYLDASANKITRLPARIDALWLTSLKLDGNSLCDLPEPLALWAERFSPGWRTRQVCP